MDHTATTGAFDSPTHVSDCYRRTMANLFLAPTRAFSTLAVTRRWLVPLMLCALGAVGYEATTSRYRMADLRDRIARDQTLSQEEVSRRLANIDAQRTPRVSYRQVAVGTGLLTTTHLLRVLGLTGILWLAVQLFPNTATFAKLFSGVSFIFLLAIPEQFLKALLINLMGSYQVYLGPAALLPVEWRGSPLYLALDHLDLFSIWMASLIVIALPILTGISRRKAAFTVVYLWLIWVLLAMLPMQLIQVD